MLLHIGFHSKNDVKYCIYIFIYFEGEPHNHENPNVQIQDVTYGKSKLQIVGWFCGENMG